MQAIAGPATELVLSGGWARCAGLRRRREALAPTAALAGGDRGRGQGGGHVRRLRRGALHRPGRLPGARRPPRLGAHPGVC